MNGYVPVVVNYDYGTCSEKKNCTVNCGFQPVSQFITDNGCIIQGVMKSEFEINRIFCPTHNCMEHVYSFDREIDMGKSPSKADRKLAEDLKDGRLKLK